MLLILAITAGLNSVSRGVPVVARGSFGNSSEQLWNPTDLDVDAHGNVYVVDTGNHLIKKYDFSGNPVNVWGGEGRRTWATARTEVYRFRRVELPLCNGQRQPTYSSFRT